MLPPAPLSSFLDSPMLYLIYVHVGTLANDDAIEPEQEFFLTSQFSSFFLFITQRRKQTDEQTEQLTEMRRA